MASALRYLPYVKAVHEQDNRLLITSDCARDYRNDLSQTITSAGGVIIGMAAQQPSLEETFVTLTDANLPLFAERVRP